MITFQKWLEQNTVGTEFVDETQINLIYDKAKYAVKLVQLYGKMTGQKILNNISTIAPLSSGVYGLYNSKENKKVIGPSVANKIKFKFGQNILAGNNINQIPNVVIKKYIPDIDLNQIKPSVVIHVNVKKIVSELGDTKQAIIEIASTIIHESTHDLEFQTTGKTNEIGPKSAEAKFKQWVNRNWNLIISRIPQLSSI
jgi:hypothetical protein